MKIKAKLQLNIWISLAVVIVMMLVLAWSFRDLQRTYRNEKLVEEMRKTAFESISLRDDYLLYREQRASIQWHKKSDTLRDLISTASGQFTTAHDKALVQEARKTFDATYLIFSMILERNRQSIRPGREAIPLDEGESYLIGQLFLKSYALIDMIGRLYESTERKAAAVHKRGAALIVFVIFGGMVILIVNSVSLNRMVAKRVANLAKGIGLIGSGYLDYRIDESGDDELSELARKSNKMAARLSMSYVSMEELKLEILAREESETRQLETNDRLEAVLAAIPDIIMEVDHNKVYTWANQQGLEFFGRDVVGKEAAFYFEGEQGTYKMVEPLFDGDEGLIYLESWQRRRDGEKRLLAWWCRSFRDKRKNIISILSSARDITEQSRAIEALQESEARYRSLHESMMDAFVQTRMSGEIELVNPSYLAMLGYTKEEILKRRYQDLTPERWHSFQLEIIETQILPRGYSDIYEKEYIRKDGTVLPVEMHTFLLRDAADHPTGMWSIVRDISQRKKDESSLHRHAERLRNLHTADQAILAAAKTPEEVAQEALQQLRSLLHCQRAGIGVFDPEQKKIRIFASEVNGVTIVQTGQDLTEEVYADLEILRQGRMDVIEDISKVTRLSPTIRMMQGEEARSSINAPLLSAQGLMGMLSVGWENPRSIDPEEMEIASEVANQIAIAFEQDRLRKETERNAAELEGRVAVRTTQLEAANKELEAFTYSVSHDLRSPLRAIDGFSRIILEDYQDKLDDEGNRLLQIIRTSTQQMDRLITDLLSLSRVTRGELKVTRIDMMEMAASVFSEITSAEERENFIFTVAPLPVCLGEPALLRQVWINLLANAVKFTRPRNERRIEITGHTEGDMSVYAVRDTGVGFNPDYTHKLFGTFQRLHKSSEFEGNGVGLAIVQRIIHRHNGLIWAEGNVNEGATFSFSLPRKELNHE
jgi:PAS domain S-box-containing protein